VVSASRHLGRTIMQSTSICHVPQASASDPNLYSFPSPTHYTAPPVCADRYSEIQTEGAVVSASHHLERTIMQSTSIFHVPRASASDPNLHSFPSPTHYTAPPVCADRYGEIQTEEAAFSASHHLERTIMQSASVFYC